MELVTPDYYELSQLNMIFIWLVSSTMLSDCQNANPPILLAPNKITCHR